MEVWFYGINSMGESKVTRMSLRPTGLDYIEGIFDEF